jgi:calcium-dependent protein kinase
MHSKSIVHRDLKPENILLEEKDESGAMQTIKLIDFGTGRKFKEGEQFSDRVGTPGYMAPEIYDLNASYDKQCDMWSIGIIAYILLCGEPPFKNKDSNDGNYINN